MYVIPEQDVTPTDRILVPRSLLRTFNQQMVCWLEDQSKAKVELMRLQPGDADLEIRIKGEEVALSTARSLIEQVRAATLEQQEAQQKERMFKHAERQEQRETGTEQAQAVASQAVSVCIHDWRLLRCDPCLCLQPQQRKKSVQPVIFVESTHRKLVSSRQSLPRLYCRFSLPVMACHLLSSVIPCLLSPIFGASAPQLGEHL